MATARGTWKSYERRIARRFGTERNSKTGLGANTADVITDKFSIECKLRAKIPSWLTDMIKQAKANCVDDTIPIVILKEKYVDDTKSLVLMELADFEQIARFRG